MHERRFVLEKIILFLLSICVLQAHAQIFIPHTFWRPKNKLTIQCKNGCYPTPSTPFTSSLYYIPNDASATFQATSSGVYDLCFGPTDAGGCQSDPVTADIYPLQCAGPGNGDIDGSNAYNEADYTAPSSSTTDTCYVTDYSENKNQASFNIQSFPSVSITSPITSSGSPRNVCVSQTLSLTGTGGLGTKTWSVILGSGSVSPGTGNSTTYTAPSSPSTVQIQLQDPTTSMADIAYVNVTNSIDLSPSGIIETPVNNTSNLQYPTGTITYVANLSFSANCGLANYTASCTGGGSVSPTSGIANNASVTFTPASAVATSTVTFTDSTAGTPQTASRTVYSIVPVDIAASWGYHTCVKYSHTTYASGAYKMKCWGYNSSSQLGNGSTTAVGRASTNLGVGLPFVKNIGTSGTDMMIKDMAVGLTHTCAILSDDTIKCWGSNTYGQLGYDNTTSLSSPPLATVNVGSGTPVKIYAAAFRTCVVFSDSRLKCWGRNARGELGQDNTTNYGSNSTTASMANLDYVSVAGSQVTVQKVALSENVTCVLTTSSFAPGQQKVYCWGYGNNATCGFGTMPDSRYCGELGKATINANWGDGTNLMSALTPVDLGTSGSETPIDLDAGRKHFCAIIAATSVSTAGTPICWGRNNIGQLGINNTNTQGDNETPTTRVTSISTAASVRLGAEVSCAILSTNDVKCWGRGGRGQLLGGNSAGAYNVDLANDTSPGIAAAVNLMFGTGLTAKKLATGYGWSCAILSNNFIKCWGNQFCGVGTNTTNNGCLLSGISATLDNTTGSPTMMDSRYIGDASTEVGNSLPYVNH